MARRRKNPRVITLKSDWPSYRGWKPTFYGRDVSYSHPEHDSIYAEFLDVPGVWEVTSADGFLGTGRSPAEALVHVKKGIDHAHPPVRRRRGALRDLAPPAWVAREWARKNFFFGGKKAKAPAVETWSVSYEVWKDRMPRRGSKKFTAEELAGWYHTTLADPTVDGVRIKSASGPGGLKRVAEILGVSQTALNNSSWTRAFNNPDTDRYQIRSDWPEELWQWGPQPRLAQWTGYPQYSYEQFYRENPRRKRSHRTTRIYFWGPSYEESNVFLSDNRRGWEAAYDQLVRTTGKDATGFIEVSDQMRAAANPSDAAAIARPWEVADNAGWPSGFQPDIFPFGQGGRPAEYMFKRDKVYTAVGNPNSVSGARRNAGRSKKRGKGVEEIITCRGVYGPHMIRRGDLFGQVEGDLVCLRCYHESLPDLPQYGKAKKNRSYVGSGARGGFVGGERDSLPNWYFLKPSTRGWPAGDPRKGARDDMHAEEVIKYMNRGFGNRSDYPQLIAKLAERYPVEDVANREIWTLYRQYRDAIDEKMSDRGVRREMPTVAELRKREVAVANRRRSRKRRKR